MRVVQCSHRMGGNMNNESMAEMRTPSVPSIVARNYTRMVLDIAVRVFPKDGPQTNGRGHDIGLGGMAMYVPLDLKLQERIAISFQLPYSRIKLGLHAVVRNRNGFRYGLEFAAMTKAESDEIQRITAIL